MDKINLIDTTLRDGQQSLWAHQMPLEAMLPAMNDIDSAGFDGIEFVTPYGQFTRFVRDLKQDPWEWLRLGTERSTSGRLRVHAGVEHRFGVSPTPLSIMEWYLGRVAGAGIRTTRLSDPWNNYPRLGRAMGIMAKHDIRAVVNIIYAVSPRHTLEYYAECTREAVKLNPYRLCLKDVSGLLTPETARSLVPVILDNANGVPVELHIHCNNGLGSYVALVAVDAGIRFVHTAIPPLADGSSQPPVFQMVHNLRSRGYVVDVDLERLSRVEEHFRFVAEVEQLPVGSTEPYRESVYDHQIPGGMMSNYRFQLTQMGHADLFEQALAEVGRVRRDLGYPIMVTPFAQFVGVQAASNVISGSRYSQVSDEVIRYALGHWGSEGPEFMDQNVRDRILSSPRASQLAAEDIATEEPTLDELRKRYDASLSNDELTTRILAGMGMADLSFKRPRLEAGTYAGYRELHSPLLRLVGKFAASAALQGVHVRGDGLELAMTKPPA